MPLTNHASIPRITIALLITLYANNFHYVLADSLQEQCVTLEHSNIPEKQRQRIGVGDYSFTMSHDRRLIALYQYFEPQKLATFKLWDTKTGKLLKTQKVENYWENSHQAYLSFSPDNSLVYLQGMTNGVPFWNLKENRLIFSPCDTAMGVTDVQFSDDMTVAYTQTIDSFHSLCRTDKSESLVNISYAAGLSFAFDSKHKYLYANNVHTEAKRYQWTLEPLTPKGMQYASVYPSPVWDHPYDADSNNSFAKLILGKAPKHRLMVVKSDGSSLAVGLWHYPSQHRPVELYQQQFTIPELASKEKPITENYYDNMYKSPNGKKAVFLSHSGVLIVFDIASGWIHWKKHLPQVRITADEENYRFSRELLTQKENKIPFIVIEQEKPKALLLFDWETGDKHTLNVPTPFSIHSYGYRQFGQYLFIEASASEDNRLLRLNWQNGEQKIINLPSNFYINLYENIPNTPLLLFSSNYSKKSPKPYSVALLNWQTWSYQIIEMPFLDRDKSHYPHLILLNDKPHLLISSVYVAKEDRGKSITLFDIEKQQHKTLVDNKLLVNDPLHHYWLDTSDKNISELPIFLYDQKNKQTQFCRVPLL